MTDTQAGQTPIDDLIEVATKRMEAGARMTLDAIPGDTSLSASMHGPDITMEIARRLRALSAARAAAMEEAKLAITQLAEDTGKQGCCGEGVQSHLGPPECCGIPITLIDAESAFDALTTLATTPPGFVCVPVEPTQAMIESGQNAGAAGSVLEHGWRVAKIYRAMLSAAPGAKE